MSKITGKIISNKGFYIGDLCYAIDDNVYDEVWGGAGYESGIYEVPGTGYSFAVADTAHGDGTYIDNSYREYSVDAGNLSLLPGELAESVEDGHYFEGAGEAIFEAEDGKFTIILPKGECVIIDTNW